MFSMQGDGPPTRRTLSLAAVTVETSASATSTGSPGNPSSAAQSGGPRSTSPLPVASNFLAIVSPRAPSPGRALPPRACCAREPLAPTGERRPAREPLQAGPRLLGEAGGEGRLGVRLQQGQDLRGADALQH